jgi:DNA-nicking Smr family endonuclease
LSSKNHEPVLKHKVRNWLMQRDDVLAFCQARQIDGGSGAVLVLLKAA